MTDQELQLTVNSVMAAMVGADKEKAAAAKAARIATLKKVGHYAVLHATHLVAGAAGFALKMFVF